MDPSAIPMDPGAIPMDPGAVPMDPGAIPMDPGAIPMDPGAPATAIAGASRGRGTSRSRRRGADGAGMPRIARPRAAQPPLDVTAVRSALAPLLDLVGPPEGAAPSASQRRALAGLQFADAPGLVRQVARGLSARPELFPDVATCGAGLAALQAQADAWRELRESLRYLEARTADRLLVLQGAAIQQALAVLRQVAGCSALPFASGLPDSKEREAALGEALVLLRRQQKRQSERALKARRPAVDASRAGRRARPAPRTKR